MEIRAEIEFPGTRVIDVLTALWVLGIQTRPSTSATRALNK